MQGVFSSIDKIVLFIYAAILVLMGFAYARKSKTAKQFMVADRSIPAWAAGLAVMSAYTSSISYIATPGKAFDDNWHPLIFAFCMIPIIFITNRYVIPYYRKNHTISVYEFLETKLGTWARVYGAFAFVLFMIGRMAVILYLAGLLLNTFVAWNISAIIISIGVITIIYTLLGGMEAVIWTDVMQSAIMIIGILFCAVYLSIQVFAQPEFLIKAALDADKFSLGSLQASLSSRTVWVMVIYGLSENLRNLVADQNYVQKYSSVATENDARRSVRLAGFIYIPLTIIFLYIGTTLFAFYSSAGHLLPDSIVKGDQVFPYFIATQVPVGLRGLIVAAILAAAMSTIDSALNCSSTVVLLDFVKRFFYPQITEKQSMHVLWLFTAVWGGLGTGFALLMIHAKSALDVWWQISGIFGGGILGLFILALFKLKLKLWQGVFVIACSVLAIAWGTFARNLSPAWRWVECTIDPIIIGALGTMVLLAVAALFAIKNHKVDS